jgi:aminoglycoside phosphotransferase family enzyme/predicted kinase
MIAIADLRRSDCYPHAPAHVEVVQTHISVVCLAGDRVYKLKKPVRLPFLDFSTAERRRHFCAEELRLNRRLCPDVYLDVVPLCRGTTGLNFRGDGATIDHAVLMKRLPAERMLDRLLAQDAVSPTEVERLAVFIAAFHARAERGAAVRRAGAPAGLITRLRANLADTEAQAGDVFDPALHRALAAVTERDITRLRPILERRAREDRIVDGHGDLHARNVCLTDPPAPYDCIEFSAAFRCGDVATETAFLTMDLRYRGHAALARTYVDAYVGASGDVELPTLLPPLERYRALVRAKVAAVAAGEAELEPADREAARSSAQRHARLAAALAAEERGRLWVAACGPPASGKSALLEALAAITGWPVMSSDRVRKELLGIPAATRAPASAYAPAVSGRVYDELFRRATASDGVMLLDANWPTHSRRTALRDAATAAGATAIVVHLDVAPAIAHRRLAARADDPRSVSDADAAVYERLAAAFEPPGSSESGGLPRLDGSLPVHVLLDALLVHLLD